MTPEQFHHINNLLNGATAQVNQLEAAAIRKDNHILSLEQAIESLQQQLKEKDAEIARLHAELADVQTWAAQRKTEEEDLAALNEKFDGLSNAIAGMLNPKPVMTFTNIESIADAATFLAIPPEPTVEEPTLVLKRPNPPADQSQSEPSV